MNRVELINKFARERDFNFYLELGVHKGHTINRVICSQKVGVDLHNKCTYQMSTDDFFKINKQKFEIIFIDADHTESQLIKDIENSLKCLKFNGVIICHDVNPPTEWHQIDENMTYQTAWKAWVKFRFRTQYLTYCIADDCGLGVIDTSCASNLFINLDYKTLEKNREFLLGI